LYLYVSSRGEADRKINPTLPGSQKQKYLFGFLKLVPFLFEKNIKNK